MPAKSLLVSRGLGAHAAGISDAPGLLRMSRREPQRFGFCPRSNVDIRFFMLEHLLPPEQIR